MQRKSHRGVRRPPREVDLRPWGAREAQQALGRPPSEVVPRSPLGGRGLSRRFGPPRRRPFQQSVREREDMTNEVPPGTLHPRRFIPPGTRSASSTIRFPSGLASTPPRQEVSPQGSTTHLPEDDSTTKAKKERRIPPTVPRTIPVPRGKDQRRQPEPDLLDPIPV